MTVATFSAAALADEHPSFDCAKAQTDIEHLICRDHDLAELDRRLAEIYKATRATLNRAGKKALLKAQRDWLAGYQQACGDTVDRECLAQRYQKRTAELLAQLTRGNVIRELGGKEPWVAKDEQDSGEEHHPGMMESCLGDDVFDGWVAESAATINTYVINGKRYLLFNADYAREFRVPLSACTTEPDENGEDVETCPQIDPEYGKCARLLVETAPGSGEFVGTEFGWDQRVTLANFLTGKLKNNEMNNGFAKYLHDKLLPGDAITLAPVKGKPSHYKWDARKQAYVKGR